ncbi:MAG: PAS domain-containing protein, partial [Planctomycetes bacterium]|nr:PAS domain-containing protein [Planctomycetota bacterium]
MSAKKKLSPRDSGTQAAKDEWEETFDAVPDPICILDTQHRIVRVNKAMAERLGVTKKECVGQTCYSCVHGTDEPPSFCPHALLLKDGQEHTVEVHEELLGGD